MATVLITGCSTGFGKLAALTFARQGHTVFASMRDTSKGGPLRDAADAEGLKISVVQLDVESDESVARGVAEVLAETGGTLDVLVNNAGMAYRGPIEQVSDAEARRQFDVNVFGVLRMIRAVLPGMRERGEGVIVNVSSVAGLVAVPYEGIYAASKHTVEAITEALHYEVRPRGVRVALVEPGQFATEFSTNALETTALAEASPYRDTADRFRASMHRLAPDGEPQDPQLVADDIVRAATDPSTPLRTYSGADADMIMAVRSTSDFETFEQTMRQALDWHD